MDTTLAQKAGGNMLLGLDPVLGPDLLHALAVMGHGDRIGLVDANYPATRGRRLIHLPGIDMPRALQAVLSVFPIDTFVPDPCAVMQVVGEPDARPPVQAEMNAVLVKHGAKPAVSLERHAFYAAAETAYAIVQTGERRFYGDILLTKGVVPPE
jgi:L-fucose mutarotase